jgi:pre-mRNA-splicing factor RBM22/SLT11
LNNLSDYFYAFGEIKSIVIVSKKKTAYVNYIDRESAVRAVESCLNDVTLNGVQVRVTWGRPKQLGPKDVEDIVLEPSVPGDASLEYPSQDPRQMGATTGKNK